MAGLIKAYRDEVDHRRSVLGFSVRTGADPWFEVVMTTDPALLGSERAGDRNSSNFYSTRALGPLPAEEGRAVFMVPPPVLLEFSGELLYYTVATFPDRARSRVTLSRIPHDALPSVRISPDFGASSVRRLIGIPNRRDAGRGNGRPYPHRDALTWAGDDVASPDPGPGSSRSPSSTSPPSPENGTNGGRRSDLRADTGTPGNGPAGAGAIPSDGGPDVEYDDGLDAAFWHHARPSSAPDRGGRQFTPSGGAYEAPAHAIHPRGGAMNGMQTMRYPGATHQASAVGTVVTVAGTVVNLVANNEGDVSWTLPTWRGTKKPWDRDDLAGPNNYQNASLSLHWPRPGTIGGLDEISLPIDIQWQHNGASVANVEVLPGRANDAAGAGLEVEAHLMDDQRAYQSRTQTGTIMAGLKITVTYRFTNLVWGDDQARTEVWIYGDGTYWRRSRWV